MAAGKLCYMCSKEVAYGQLCSKCKNIICTFPSCATAHEESEFAAPIYFYKNCTEDALPFAGD